MRLKKTLVALLASVAAMSAVAAGPGTSAAAAREGRLPSGERGAQVESDSAAPVWWVGAWAAAQQQGNRTSPSWTWARDGFRNHSVRQVVRLSTGGHYVRIRLSNLYGRAPLRVTGVTVALAGAGAGVQGQPKPVTFGSRRSVVIPTGTERSSDALSLPVQALHKLTVTMHFNEWTGPATYHKQARATTYRAAGNHLNDATSTAFTERSSSWYFLSRVEVRYADRARQQNGIVTLGDSITDGVNSTVDADNRYPDQLAERLRGTRPVLNSGLSGNQLLSDTYCFGLGAQNRFRRDVVAQPGVRTVIVLLGVNDILRRGRQSECWQGTAPMIDATGRQITAGYQNLIKWARTRGLRVIGATLPPCPCAAQAERIRQAVNTWIRNTPPGQGGYDAVIDFDRALRDPAQPQRLLPRYNSGDNLHPNDAGFSRMAQAVDLSTL